MLLQVTGDEAEGRSGRPKACSEYKSASGRLRLSVTASSGNGEEADAAGRRPAPNIRAPADGLGSAYLLPQETARRPKADAAGRRPAPNIRAPADGLGSAKPLPQETVRAPRSGDPRFVRKITNHTEILLI